MENAIRSADGMGENAIKVPQVESEFGRMDSDIVRLEATVERLGAMLASVLRGAPPQNLNTANAKITEALVPRAEQVRKFRDRIAQVSNQIDSITERLEV